MREKVISATEAARGFSAVLDQVQFRDRSFAIERGRKIVARLVPPTLPDGLPLADLNRLLATLPRLGSTESRRWTNEVRALRRSQRLQRRQWG